MTDDVVFLRRDTFVELIGEIETGDVFRVGHRVEEADFMKRNGLSIIFFNVRLDFVKVQVVSNLLIEFASGVDLFVFDKTTQNYLKSRF